MFRAYKKDDMTYLIELPLRKFHIRSPCALSETEFMLLYELLESFPHSPTSLMQKSYDHEWVEKFGKIPFHIYPAHILKIAANAFDCYGRSVLSISCEWGACLDITKKLLELGADVNAIESDKRIDKSERKVSLHWAISNKLSYFEDKDSDEFAAVVKLLLEYGADENIKCYMNMTVYEYAVNRQYTAAVRIMDAAREEDYLRLRFL